MQKQKTRRFLDWIFKSTIVVLFSFVALPCVAASDDEKPTWMPPPLTTTGNENETNHLHDGFYLGLGAGYDSYKMRHSVNIIQNGSSVFQQNPELNAVGLSYNFVGGYGRYFDTPLYIGAEFFYNYSQANTNQNIGLYQGTTGIYAVKSVILGNYGLSLTPGLKLSDSTLLYVKGGYTRVDVKTYETSAALNINNAQSNGVNGFHFGLGLEADIYKNWSVRGEYTHVSCENFKTHEGTMVTPSDNQFMLGLILHVI